MLKSSANNRTRAYSIGLAGGIAISHKRSRCQFSYHDLRKASSPMKARTLQNYLYTLKMHVIERKNLFRLLKNKIFSKLRKRNTHSRTRRTYRPNVTLNLQPGELVEVLSEDEIRSTLDSNGKLKGLAFMPEMKKYCEKRFKVYKRLEKIVLETTGEMRNIKNTVLLVGVICDGSAHFGCDRSCFCFWREAWLRRV